MLSVVVCIVCGFDLCLYGDFIGTDIYTACFSFPANFFKIDGSWA